MDIKQLKHFLAVADTHSVAGAAKRVGITQSGLSRSIQALEAAAGLPLLERRSKGVVLTEFGEELLPRAKAILNERERALTELQAFARLEQGNLAIGVMPNFDYAVTPKLIGRLVSAAEGISISVSTASYDELIGRLLGAELHFALLLAVAPGQPELSFHQLCASESAVFVAKKHPLAKVGRLRLGDLLDYPWALTESQALTQAFEAFFRARVGTVPSLRLSCGSIALLAQSMQEAPLLSVLPRPFGQSDLLRGRLVALDVEAPANEAHAWLAIRPQTVPGPAFQVALRILREMFPAAALPGQNAAHGDRVSRRSRRTEP